MTRAEIEFLLESARTAQLPMVEFQRGRAMLRVCFDAVAADEKTVPQNFEKVVAPAPMQTIKSPQMGIFSMGHPMATDLVNKDNRQVVENEIVGFVQVRDVLVPVSAPSAGTIRLVYQSGSVVGFGDIVYEYL